MICVLSASGVIQSFPRCLKSRGRDREEKLAVGGALVLDFDARG